ncbi:MAG TPA: TIGR01777 family oxidoreductase, partial [Gemmatimonadales bacterium]|nr:TIGR01777 family oxidoreductase [Gemmatimonadales bacterium]
VTRHPAGPDDIAWNPTEGKLDPAALEGADGVVHLAGEAIAGGRWTGEQRERILQSRVRGTTLLAETLARLQHRPAVLISASGINIYGDRGAEVLTEQAGLRPAPARTFIEQVGQGWEAATEPAEHAGIRVVRARLGMVLSPAGGALAQMLPPFEAGLGGRLGSGQQYLGWISIDDAVGALYHALTDDALRGPLNVTAPEPVTNQEFTAVLGRVLHRPTVIPVPGAGLRLIFGDLADELLLASTRVVPARLRESGYVFRQPDLAQALRHVLGR